MIINPLGAIPWLAGKLMKRKPSLDEAQAQGAATLIWLVLLALVAVLVVNSCSGSRQDAAQAEQDVRSAAAVAATAQEAAAIAIAQAEDEATVDDLVAAAIEEIDNAPNDQVAGAAARAAICSLPEYRDDPAC